MASAVEVTINFDNLTAMSYFSGTPIPTNARLSTQLLSTTGAMFSSGSSYVAVVNLGVNHARSGVNGIGGSTSGGMLTYAAANPIKVEFFNPADGVTPWVTNSVSIAGDLMQDSGGNLTLKAYDIDGVLIGTSIAPDIAPGPITALSVANIHSIQIIGVGDNNGIALDDLRFESVRPQIVPEPGSMCALAGMVGAVMLRGRRR